MAGDPYEAAPTGADEEPRRAAAAQPAPGAVERPILHSDGVVCA